MGWKSLVALAAAAWLGGCGTYDGPPGATCFSLVAGEPCDFRAVPGAVLP